jgi:chromate reductase
VPPVRHVVGVVGSLRKDSFNGRLLRHAAEVAPDRLALHVHDDLLRLPLFDEDLEIGGLPDEVIRMQEVLAGSDGIVLASPEYNFGVPGPVKNFVDWASRPVGRGPLVGKPVALIGASISRIGGTLQAQGQLRVSLAIIGAHVLPSPPVLVTEAHDRFDGHVLIDEPSEKVLRYALGKFLDWIDTFAVPEP